MTESSALLPCPFCGPGQSMVSLWFDDVSKRWRVGCGRCGCSTGTSPRDKTQAPAIAAWNTRAAPSAQEPVAREALAHVLRTAVLLYQNSLACAAQHHGIDIELNGLPGWLRDSKASIDAALAALPSSPAPLRTPHNSGERLPSSDAAEGAGEAIFEECAEIALACVGQEDLGHNAAWSGGYDKACRDIAEAIELRASNRKTMDALATKDSR